MSALKALFFVKSLDGDAAHNEAMSVEADDPRARGSHLVELRLKDGERMVAFANRFPPLGAVFFLVPVDAKSNNLRILVNRAEVLSISRFDLRRVNPAQSFIAPCRRNSPRRLCFLIPY